MNPEKFIEFVRKNLTEAAADDAIKLLEEPPGKQPPQDLVRLSDWFKSLSHEDKNRVHDVARMAAHGASFGWCAILDGVRAFDDENGELELHYAIANQRVRLNRDSGEMLHDILNSGPIPPER